MISTKTPKNVVAIDLEATGIAPWFGAKMFAASAVFPSGRILFWRNTYSGLRSILKDPKLDKVFQNAKYDLRMLEAAGFTIRGRIWDTMVFAHLLNPAQKLSLDALAKRYLPKSRHKIVDEINEWFDQNKIKKDDRPYSFAKLPPKLLQERCQSDAAATLLLFLRFYPVVAQNFSRLLGQEHKVLHVSKRMEDRGLLIDLPELQKQKRYLQRVVDDVELWCQAFIGSEDFQITKPADQKYILQKAGIYDHIEELTKTGKKSLRQKSLQALNHPVAQMLALGKQASSLRSTFLGQMERFNVNSVIHPGWNQLGTVTGRFSGSKPNLMNMPEEGGHWTSEEEQQAIELAGIALAPHIKRVFVCRPGYCMYYSDKEKIEVCMLAHYTGDKVMLDVMRKGLDIHKEMSLRMFGEAKKGLRVRAKITVFGFQYGAGNKLLAKNCKCSLAEAKKYRARLMATCPTLLPWRNGLIQQLYDQGFIITDHGRRHYVPHHKSYMVVNRMCQGTAADEVKSRMVALDDFIERDFPDCRILLNVHDALGIEIPLELAHKVIPTAHNILEETSIPFKLPLRASSELTKTRWANLKKIKAHEPKTITKVLNR